MILEVAILKIRDTKEKDFEQAFSKAKEIIRSSKGYRRHQLQKCIEIKGKYILLVEWESLEDHTEVFRRSKEYEEWKKLLHHFYDPFPTVEHFYEI